MRNEPLIKTYIWHDDRCFFVSTIGRDLSAAELPLLRFAETIAWRFDWAENKRLESVAEEGASLRGAFDSHMEVCRQLRDKGRYEVSDD